MCGIKRKNPLSPNGNMLYFSDSDTRQAKKAAAIYHWMKCLCSVGVHSNDMTGHVMISLKTLAKHVRF